MTTMMAPEELLDEHDMARLRWSCRRGLLENDLFLERFFKRHTRLDRRQAMALARLMELGDHDLLDLHLARKPLAQVDPSLDDADIRGVLSLLRAKH